MSFSEAARTGLAPDGGLYVPELPGPLPIERLEALRGSSFATIAEVLAVHLLAGELGESTVRAFTREALDFPVPLRAIPESGESNGLSPSDEHTGEEVVHLLELFHGPTLAFKDIGARFMARLLAAVEPEGSAPRTVLVATSGDTGGAVADAFHELPGFRVVVLYPKRGVSPLQEAQFATLGGNVLAIAVHGTFDDCQRLAKEAFLDPGVSTEWSLTSANSINVARLLPQAFYYLHAWIQLGVARPLLVSVPCGNLGNLMGGVLATRLGLRGARFVAATNVNDVFLQYLATGAYDPRVSRRTVANAMDVGAPSNLERLEHTRPLGFWRPGSPHAGDGVGGVPTIVPSGPHTDIEIVSTIRKLEEEHAVLVDPHTAVAWRGLREATAFGWPGEAVALATAHPAKFADAVRTATGEERPLPEALARAATRPSKAVDCSPDLSSVTEALERHFQAP